MKTKKQRQRQALEFLSKGISTKVLISPTSMKPVLVPTINGVGVFKIGEFTTEAEAVVATVKKLIEHINETGEKS